jgi:enterochelin esterase-like enzyme
MISVVNVPSKLLKQPTELRVYTPPCYSASATTRYPVLYMLHGQTYTDAQWQQLGLTTSTDQLIASRQISPFIIVMPNEAASMSDADTSKFGDALINEVIPWVDANYSTCDVRECRAIGGLSRGGNWAVRIGMSHPDYFAVIGAHSTPLFYGDLNRISAWIKATPDGTPTPMIYIDFGKGDEERDLMLQFDQELSRLGVAHQMIQFNGSHDADYWSAHVAQYLRWYSAALASPQG